MSYIDDYSSHYYGQDLVPEMKQTASYETELLSSIMGVRDAYGDYSSALTFFDAFTSRIQERSMQDDINSDEENLYVIAIGGLGAMGKTNFLNQYLMHTVSHLSGEEHTELPPNLLTHDGKEMEVATCDWIDILKVAQKYGWAGRDSSGRKKLLGNWDGNDFNVFDVMLRRAADVYRQGIVDQGPRSRDKIRILGFSGPLNTATIRKTDGEEIYGYNRGVKFLYDLANDQKISGNVFASFLLTDGHSMKRRLTRRGRLPDMEGNRESLRNWIRNSNIKVSGGNVDEYVLSLPETGATVYAATIMRYQMDELLLTLNETRELPLLPDEVNLIHREMNLISDGVLITDRKIYQHQDRRNSVMVRFYDFHTQQLNLPSNRVFIGFNPDIEAVHFFPSLSQNRNLIQLIEEKDPNLLNPHITL